MSENIKPRVGCVTLRKYQNIVLNSRLKLLKRPQTIASVR